MSESELIKQVIEAIGKPPEQTRELVEKVKKECNTSELLNYYMGAYYKTIDKQKSITHFEKAIKLQPLFTAPYYELVSLFIEDMNKELDDRRSKLVATDIDIGRRVYKDLRKVDHPIFLKIEKLLMSIFNVKTIDYKTAERKKDIYIEDCMKVYMMLGSIYSSDRVFDKIFKLYDVIIKLIDPKKHLLYWKIVNLDIGQIYFHQNKIEQSYQSYCNGFKYGIDCIEGEDIKQNCKIIKSLIEACLITRQYITSYPSLPISITEVYDYIKKHTKNEKIITKSKLNEKFVMINGIQTKIYNLNFKNTFRIDNSKIRIGYLTPDLNKNAVGLFMTAFLKHYNEEKFEVFVFYTNEQSDAYTLLFKKYKTNWYDLGKIENQEKAQIIQNTKLDVLVDLIGQGHGNNLETIMLLKENQPSLKVITYLGFPGSTMLPFIDYRIVDNITDTIKSNETTETLLKLDPCFLCYHPFDNEEFPNIKPRVKKDNFVHIGILNKSSKHSPEVLKDWKEIMERRKDIILHIKLDQNSEFQKSLYKELPEDRIIYYPFQDFIQDYYDIYNNIDFCLDTYPYSGTTTTCSALFMGIPTFTKYDKKNLHLSNVSASILSSCGLTQFICSPDTFIDTICNYNHKDNREEIRQSFLNAMEPKKFMKQYEKLILSL